MSNRKTTSISNHAISEIEEARLSYRNKIDKKGAHDRPAIFIEELKNQDQYNHTNKNKY